MFDEHPRAVLVLGVVGISISAILVRFSQAPSVITAVYRLGWTVLLLLPMVLTKFRGELLPGQGQGRIAVRPQRPVPGPPLPYLV